MKTLNYHHTHKKKKNPLLPVRPSESLESRGTPAETKLTMSSMSAYLAACKKIGQTKCANLFICQQLKLCKTI